jgi:FUS-interacting serine-arginine-rich protein 1
MLNSEITTLYRNLRRMAFQDPILRAIAEGEISWDQAATSDDEAQYEAYVSKGEGADIIASVQEEYRKREARKSRVSWTSEPQVIASKKEDPSQQVQVQQVTTTVLFNPNQVKTLITRNLPRDVTAEELRSIFSKYGPIQDVYIPKNLDPTSPYYGSVKGFALIKFMSHTDSTRAYLAESTHLFLRGKMISIEFANKDK